MSPYLETLPYVGVIPTTPQKEAGQEMEPPVDTPKATWPGMVQAAAAAPPLEPPQARSRSYGFLGIPKLS